MSELQVDTSFPSRTASRVLEQVIASVGRRDAFDAATGLSAKIYSMPPSPLTEADYRRKVRLLSNEIEQAVIIYHTYEEINRLAGNDQAILSVLNSNVQFWKTQMHCLQTTLFITLGRIFDENTNAETIRTVLTATVGNLQLFSGASLEARKVGAGVRGAMLKAYMANVWVPQTASDLRHLQKALAPHAKRFEAIYRPIRHSTFAHRLMDDDEAGAQLFAATNRTEIGEIIDFLHDLISTIDNLYLNGHRPILGTRDFREYNQHVRDDVGSVLERLG